jgi:hypothetical protein
MELLVAEGRLLAGALDLDEAALAGHDDVEVDLGVLVLDVGEVEQLAAAEDADADGGHRVGEGILGAGSLRWSISFWTARRAAT